MPAYKDKGCFKVPRGSLLRISFNASIRFLIAVYQNDILVFNSEKDKENEVEISPDHKRTVLRWSVIPCEAGPWKYEIIIKANGEEVAHITNEVESDTASFQRRAVIIQMAKIRNRKRYW